MSSYWYDSDDSVYYSDGDDYEYDYYVEEPCPIEFLPFRDLIEAGEGYMETQREYPLWIDELIEFLAIADSTTSGYAYERELKFHKFLFLPAELRLNIYGHYLENARSDATLRKHLHYDDFSKPCCVWQWPEELIVCDRMLCKELRTADFAPWLPALAFVNKQLLGEITICMLQGTDWIEFKYDENKPFKIVRWFTDFLSTFPTLTINGVDTTEGFAAIKRINFPHEGIYNMHRIGKVIHEQNPDIMLMPKCTELDIFAISFHHRQLFSNSQPRDIDEFLDHFHFRPMLEHKGVKIVYLEGVHPKLNEGNTLECLERFGKWLVKGFKDQGRDVNVHINKRWKIFKRRTVGQKVVLEEEAAKGE
jgi:hypothetical protein